MVIIHSEKLKSDFDGTIIDIETIGEFEDYYDSRRYKNHIPVIFGSINKEGLKIYCAKSKNSIEKLKTQILRLMSVEKSPFHAFNSDFERGVLFHSLNKEIKFEKELNKEKFERKGDAVIELGIPNYNDPFNDNGFLSMKAWLNGELQKAIAHNRSCLLKERDILLKRGFRDPDELRLVQ